MSTEELGVGYRTYNNQVRYDTDTQTKLYLVVVTYDFDILMHQSFRLSVFVNKRGDPRGLRAKRLRNDIEKV